MPKATTLQKESSLRVRYGAQQQPVQKRVSGQCPHFVPKMEEEHGDESFKPHSRVILSCSQGLKAPHQVWKEKRPQNHVPRDNEWYNGASLSIGWLKSHSVLMYYIILLTICVIVIVMGCTLVMDHSEPRNVMDRLEPQNSKFVKNNVKEKSNVDRSNWN